MDRLPVPTRKHIFVRLLLPHLLYQNAVIRNERAEVRAVLENLSENRGITRKQRRRIAELLKRYRFRGAKVRGAVDGDLLEALMRRMDEIPVPLALSQAAIESGWGISRFAREGNNLFGHWKMQGREGMVPDQRPEGATYSLAVFPHLSAAVERYFLNLNTHRAYRKFRTLRYRMREETGNLNPGELAGALERYSERGRAYVQDVRMIMAQNGLEDIGRARLVYTIDTRNLLRTLSYSFSAGKTAVERRSPENGQV